MTKENKAIVVSGKNELVRNDIRGLLNAPLFDNIEKKIGYSTIGERIKTPLEKRLKDSKFAQVIEGMPLNELKILLAIVGFSPKGMQAIKMFMTAENSTIQVYALKKKLIKEYHNNVGELEGRDES